MVLLSTVRLSLYDVLVEPYLLNLLLHMLSYDRLIVKNGVEVIGTSLCSFIERSTVRRAHFHRHALTVMHLYLTT